ncbi:hypothetical protein H2248_003972 [Termitomyces sp. 'cryptogamus']|nr:hypothetical protein H2248_003972 [Termitomyces sp. 'cryptogamus']
MFKSVFAKLIAGFLRLRKLLCPLRLLSFLRSLYDKISALFRGRSPTRDLDKLSHPRIQTTEPIEEEDLSGYQAEWYYPVRIGEVFASRYQVVVKLGYGVTSTVWLARDLTQKKPCYIALKVYVHQDRLGSNEPTELAIYRRLKEGPENHAGRKAIRPLLDSFVITGPDGEHHCLVHPPLWGSLQQWLDLDEKKHMQPPDLAMVLKQLFLALDYAKECEVIHTDIHEGNIMFGLKDTAVLEELEKAELEEPSPRKRIAEGRFIYQTRDIPLSDRDNMDLPLLCDFGAAVMGGGKHDEDVQPDPLRCPEAILRVPWSYEIDIWNVGCLVWYLCRGSDLFRLIYHFKGPARGYAYLAEMVSLLGYPPPSLIADGKAPISSEFFSEDGRVKTKFVRLLNLGWPGYWKQMENSLDDWESGDNKNLFLGFMRKMLKWDPRDRQTAKQLLEDEWLMIRLETPSSHTADVVEE